MSDEMNPNLPEDPRDPEGGGETEARLSEEELRLSVPETLFEEVPVSPKKQKSGGFLSAAFVFEKLKKTFGFAIGAPCSYFDDVVAFSIGCTNIKAVLPAIGIGLFERIVNVNNIIAVVVFICAVFDHIISFAFKNNFTHFFFLRIIYYIKNTIKFKLNQ